MLTASLKGRQPQPYLLQVAIELSPTVDLEKWCAAWERVLAAEPLLRFDYSNCRVRDSQTNIQFNHEYRWLESSAEQFKTQVALTLQTILDHGFSLTNAKGSLLQRSDLFIGPKGQAVWAITIHHALVDGVSLQSLFTKLRSAYHDTSTELVVDKRFFRWAEDVQQSDFSAAKQYFDALQHNEHPAGMLCEFVPRARQQTNNSRTLRIPIDINVTPDARIESSSLPSSALIHTAWAMALRQIMGSDAVVFGVTRHCRKSAAYSLTDAIGPFANTIPLVVNIHSERTVLEQLEFTRSRWLELAKHERCPLRISGAAISGSSDALVFDTLVDIAIHARSQEIKSACGDEIAETVRFQQTTDIPISLVVVLEPQLQATLVVTESTARSETMVKLAELFRDCYEWLCRHPNSRMSEWDTHFSQQMIPPAVLAAPTSTIVERFHKLARQSPEHIAIRTPVGSWTFSELWSAAAKYAAALIQSQHEGGEEIVPVIGGRTFALIAAILGVLRAGRAFLIIASDTPPVRLRELCELSGARCLINTDPSVTEALPLPSLSIESNELACGLEPSIAPAQLAYLVATSGTTGTPKLVMVEHGSLENIVAAYSGLLNLHAGDVRYQSATVASDTFVLETMLYLSSGASLILDPDLIQRGFEEMNQRLREHGATILGLPSSLWREWATYNLQQNSVDAPVSSLRAVICSMERTDPEILRLWRESVGRNLLWINAYGPSEATCVSTAFCLLPDEPTPSDDIPIGRDFANVRTYVLNAQGHVTPPGFVGEIVIGGIGVARGYLRNPEITREKFVFDPFQTAVSSRMYHSGDRGFRNAQGDLIFVGRQDHQVKIRGQRIELEEIEHLLLCHPLVTDAAVVVVEEQGRKGLVAFYRSSGEVPVDHLQTHLQTRLAASLVPNRFHRLEEIPRSGLGKICRADLVAQAKQMPRSQAWSSPRNIVAPQSPLESRLLKIWRDVLQSDDFGIHDNFFLLGGDSLLAVHLFTEMGKWTKSPLPLASLLQAQTIAQLAEVLSREGLLPDIDSPIKPAVGDSDTLQAVTPMHPWSSEAKASALAPNEHINNASSTVEKNINKPILTVFSATGNLPPVILLPSLGGEIFIWKEIAANWPTNRPLYAISLAGENSPWSEQATLPEIAQHYLLCLQELNVQGPIHLAGYSFGGYLAFEMAQQLLQAGKQVGQIVIIDTGRLRQKTSSFRKQFVYPIQWMRNLPNWLLDNVLATSPAYWFSELRRKTNQWRQQLFQRKNSDRNSRDALEAVIDTRSFPEPFVRCMRVALAAAQRYEPREYSGAITIIRARTRPLFGSFDPDLGWGELSRAGAHVATTPGDHNSILKAPHSHELVARLTTLLARND